MVYAIDITNSGFAPAKFANLGTLVNLILALAMTGAAVIFLVMMLMAAYAILTNGDNPDAIKKAQQSMVFAIIGLAIVVFSFLLVSLLGKMIGATNILPQ